MSLGFDREPNIVNMGDTAKLVAFLYDSEDNIIEADDIVSVSFQVAAPDNTRTTEQGEVQDDGSGELIFADTAQVGQYLAVATFDLLNNERRSTRVDFEVIDPFKSLTPSPSYLVAEAAWMKLEDCFDAEDEGPWLRDMTLNYFNKDKMEAFIAEALFFINQANPPTNLDVAAFVTLDGSGDPVITVDLPLLAQAVFIQVLRHLIRSYVEQPQPQGAQIAWSDRRDYLQRWQSVLQIESEAYRTMLALYKRRFLGLGQSRMLVSSKAGRLIAAPMRTRNIGRGYW